MEVDDGGVDVPQVNDLCLFVAILMQDGVGADEKENPDSHDEGAEDLQPIRIQIPVDT